MEFEYIRNVCKYNREDSCDYRQGKIRTYDWRKCCEENCPLIDGEQDDLLCKEFYDILNDVYKKYLSHSKSISNYR